MQTDPEVRQRARRLMLAPQKEREEVVERYRAALELEGDPARGAQVFEQICSKCHLFNGIGHELGPDLETIRGRPAYLLLNDILMPNQSIAQTYEAYVSRTHHRRRHRPSKPHLDHPAPRRRRRRLNPAPKHQNHVRQRPLRHGRRPRRTNHPPNKWPT
jgi:hypothetical protein